MSELYESNGFEQWIKHFRFSDTLKDLLIEFGATCVSDLADVYAYEDVMRSVQEKVTVIEYKKFLRACKSSKVLADVVLPNSVCATLLPSASIVSVASTISGSAAQPAESATKRMSTAKATLQALKRTDSSAAHVSSKEAKIREMQEEIRRIQERKEEAASVSKREKAIAAQLAATKKRKRLIDNVEDQLRDAASLDVAVVLDCTGSMAPYIAAAKDQVQDFVASLGKVYPDIPLRIAFVGYRDHCDGDKRLAVLRFTDRVCEFHKIVGEQTATGGGDTPEDVFGALKIATTLEWASATRILYHIGDAPCHGTPEFHDFTDSHPKGDPHGLKAPDLLTALQKHKVQYYFGRITSQTDKMIARFNAIMGGEPPFVTSANMHAGNMMSVITSSVTASLTATLSTSVSTDAQIRRKLKAVHLVPTMPIFKGIAAETAHKYRLRVPTSANEVVNSTADNCLEAFPDDALVTVKVAPHPFATGSMKAAYYAHDCGTNSTVILKETRATSAAARTLPRYEAFLACHYVAAHLAAEFNKVKPPACETIRFCEASVLQLTGRAGQPYFIQEEQLVGRFEKFNNNSGLCSPFPTEHGTAHQAVQAFSHWTHSVTKGAMMVVDCQGVYDRASNTFRLTDPAIHCTALTRFGGTNLGRIGFERFYKTHVCNEHCKALKLSEGK